MFPHVNILAVCAVYLPAWWVHEVQMCQTQQLWRNSSLMWNTHITALTSVHPSLRFLADLPISRVAEHVSVQGARDKQKNKQLASCEPDYQTTARNWSLSSQILRTCWTRRTKRIENRGMTAETRTVLVIAKGATIKHEVNECWWINLSHNPPPGGRKCHRLSAFTSKHAPWRVTNLWDV